MVEVDPMILFAAGTIAASLAAAALCLRPSQSSADKIIDKVSQNAATVKPKKKQTRSAKKSAPATEIVFQSEESEIAAIMADITRNDAPPKPIKKAKDTAKNANISAADAAAAIAARKAADIAEIAAAKELLEEEAREEAEAAALVAKQIAEDEEKKSKKAKESPEQKAARLERVRLAKVKKVEEEELSKSAAIELATAESMLIAQMMKAASSAVEVRADGWAVVEDKRKVKAKALPPVVIAPVATDSDVPSEPAVPVDFVKAEISVDAKKIGVIIGPKGVTLHGIQDLTGVEINTPKGDRDSSVPVIITISGTAEGVATASRAINDLCAKGYSKLLAGEDFRESSIDVHPIYLSEIIGKGGLNIRAIQDFTGVKLSVPQVSRDHVLPVRVSIAGNVDKVQEAKNIITELTKFYHTSVTHPGQIHAEIFVPQTMYNYIIGARGSEIKQIQNNFKVSVYIPNVDSVTKSVVVVGEPEGVKAAEKHIQKIIDLATADREAAEKMADSWVDGAGEEGSSHSTARPDESASSLSLGFKSGAASAIAAASASAWGASILSSADGW